VQTANIVSGALGVVNTYSQYDATPIYDYIRQSVAHEHGRASLARDSHAPGDVLSCLRTEQDVSVWLDVVELSLRSIERNRGKIQAWERQHADIKISPEDAVAEINERFRRAGFGFRYESGKIFRADSELVHQEVTKPALDFLQDPRFAGANQEFRAAHDHFKAGEYRDCAVDALNALESTMKSICAAKKWEYPKGARAADLLKILRNENLFPNFADQSFEQLLATLKSGLPVVRNEVGAHGQGAQPVEIPAYVASYALNLAATKILFLADAFKASAT
jgi:hypothetical protein